jgi:hypothetical protein
MIMLRSAFVTFSLALALGAAASAQVTVNGGYATTYPVAVTPQIVNTVTSEGIPAVPAINTPVAHVGAAAVPPTVPGETSQPAVVPEAEITQPINVNQPLNLGVSSAELNPFVLGDQNLNGESLADAAREIKHKDQATNAKMYTNADIDKLNQSAGAGNGVSANAQNDNWPANNGVITQQPPAIGSPAQNQSTTGTSPFAPQSATPSNNQPENPPQAMNAPESGSKPSAGAPYEMAQNDASNAGVPQAGGAENSSNSAPATLPKTASRLPLLGVLGFFSISMGLFVRYQREKATK